MSSRPSGGSGTSWAIEVMQRRSLLWHIFPPFLAIIILTLLLVTGFSSRALRHYQLSEAADGLAARARLLADQVDTLVLHERWDELQKVTRRLGQATDTRFTVGPDGRQRGGRFPRAHRSDGEPRRPAGDHRGVRGEPRPRRSVQPHPPARPALRGPRRRRPRCRRRASLRDARQPLARGGGFGAAPGLLADGGWRRRAGADRGPGQLLHLAADQRTAAPSAGRGGAVRRRRPRRAPRRSR